ncbi:sulfotransferase [Nocardioides sp. CER19]|uniref:sulfotransferase family protein n=1 Tax=Nocardioides sp. CER19 TaxID=3038538 RepID=UPI0024471109|nr:sulfotransferase [Nocardioides sp. CER19]MDH2413286.1 sulfotransferase [Nocardioides sp. CER19]
MTRPPRPDFLIAGAPKAGTTALHAALAQHPEVFVSTPKEAKYWLCDESPPPHYNGPGDRHSQQEWIWRRDDYDALWTGARDDQVRGESTPFYLWSRGAHRRIGEALPDVKIIAIVRDPVDRAYSNWMHLWCDGLEPVADFSDAFALERERISRGYAPFWRYRELGLYGAQLEHLYQHVDRAQVLVMRYRELVDDPVAAVDRACAFLGVATGVVSSIPKDNSRTYVMPGWRPRVIGPIVRAGAWAGQFAPPEVWRSVSPAVTRHLVRHHEAVRPHLTAAQREALVPEFADDIALLSSLTGDDYSEWLSSASRGSFVQRAMR